MCEGSNNNRDGNSSSDDEKVNGHTLNTQPSSNDSVPFIAMTSNSHVEHNGLNRRSSDEFLEEAFEDPMCRSDKPITLAFEEITSASYKIKSNVLNTPCVKSHLSKMTGMDIYLKNDFLQHTGSFKERGACYALMCLPEAQKKIGVISASLGNHSLALCYHGQRLHIPITVVMPLVAPIMKIQKCRSFGANVIVQGKDMSEARKIALKISKECDLVYINGYDHPHIMAGQGTIGLEILEQVPNVDAVVVPVGGGGLIAGIAVAIKTLNPRIKIIGVESERCASFSAAINAEKPVLVPNESTLADGLAVRMVGHNAFATAKPLIDEIVVVKEQWIAIGILRLLELEKCVVEGGGSTGLAAILSGKLDHLKGKTVCLLLSGGNIDTTLLGRVLERGLACDGRLVRFVATVSDRPGGIKELCDILTSLNVSIKDIMHERAWISHDVFSVDVKVVCETRDREHAEELRKTLALAYRCLNFMDIDAL